MEETKKCPRCGRELPKSEFSEVIARNVREL